MQSGTNTFYSLLVFNIKTAQNITEKDLPFLPSSINYLAIRIIDIKDLWAILIR